MKKASSGCGLVAGWVVLVVGGLGLVAFGHLPAWVLLVALFALAAFT